MKLRLCLCLAAISVVLSAAGPLRPARRPRYGGTLRVEIGAIIHSLDPAVAAVNPEEAGAKAELDADVYKRQTQAAEDGDQAGALRSAGRNTAQGLQV